MNLRIRDLSDVSKNQSYDRSARTPAVHVSLSSDLIVKQRILKNNKAETFNPKHLGPNLPARFSLLQENQEREEFRVSHQVSGAVDGRFIGPTNQNCQATCRRKFKNFKTPRFPRDSAGENFRDAANLIAATQNFSKNFSKKSKPLFQASQPHRQRLKMPYQNTPAAIEPPSLGLVGLSSVAFDRRGRRDKHKHATEDFLHADPRHFLQLPIGLCFATLQIRT